MLACTCPSDTLPREPKRSSTPVISLLPKRSSIGTREPTRGLPSNTFPSAYRECLLEYRLQFHDPGPGSRTREALFQHTAADRSHSNRSVTFAPILKIIRMQDKSPRRTRKSRVRILFDGDPEKKALRLSDRLPGNCNVSNYVLGRCRRPVPLMIDEKFPYRGVCIRFNALRERQ